MPLMLVRPAAHLIVLMFIIVIVNILMSEMLNKKSEFDKNKDKSQFRDYDAACDRVKCFYEEQHGMFSFLTISMGSHSLLIREANCCV
jgi:hypothetical protein